MTVKCVHCHAFHWLNERVKNSPKLHPEFARCCHHGKVLLQKLPEPPERLRKLYSSEDSDVKHFQEHKKEIDYIALSEIMYLSRIPYMSSFFHPFLLYQYKMQWAIQCSPSLCSSPN